MSLLVRLSLRVVARVVAGRRSGRRAGGRWRRRTRRARAAAVPRSGRGRQDGPPDDRDVQVLGDLPDVEHVVRAQPQLGPGKFGEPVSFGFESSSRLLPAGRAVSAGGELVLHVLEQVTG